MSSMQKGPTAGGGGGDDECCEIERLSQLMDGEWGGIDLSQSVVGLCGDKTLRLKWARFHLARDAMQQEPVSVGDALSARICAAIAAEDTYSNVTAISNLTTLAASAGADETDAVNPDSDRVEALPGAVAGDKVPEETTDAIPRVTTTDRGAGRAGLGVGGPRTFAAGFGLAASVALVTVVGLNTWQGRTVEGDSTATVPVQSLASADGAGRSAFESPTTLPPGSGDNDVAATEETVVARQGPDVPLPEVQFVANTGAYWIAPESLQRRTGAEDRLNMMLSDHIENSPTAERHGMLPYSRLVGYGEGAVGR